MTGIDPKAQETATEYRLRMEQKYPHRHMFERALRQFVETWAPSHPADQYEMQLQLSMLLRDAMWSQTETFAHGADHLFSQQLMAASMQPLIVLQDKPKT